MIKGILFALFFVLLFASIGLATLFGVTYSKSKNDNSYREGLERGLEKIRDKYEAKKTWGMKREEVLEINNQCIAEQNAFMDSYKSTHTPTQPKGKVGLIATIIASIAMLGAVIAVPGSFHQVEAGTYAVVKRVGRIVDVRTPGTYFDFYMTKHYEVYDATVQQVKINTSSYSKDGQTMDLEVYLQYQIQLDKLVIKDENGKIIQTEGIAGKYVTLASLQARIETQCIEKTKAVMSSAEAMTIIQNRAEYSEEVSRVVRDAIGPDYYVNVQDVVLTNIDFTDEFEKSVEDKVVAEQQKTAAETKANAEAEVARIKAEAEKTVAEIEAEKKVIEATADAEVVKIAAQAQAKATVARIIELARTVGFTVNETETGYEILFDAIHTEEMFKTIVEDYIQYLEYLGKWNGELPQVVAGDDAVSIIVPNN